MQPAELKRHAAIRSRVDGVRASRLKSPTQSVRDATETPMLFTQDRQPDGPFLAIPEVSSERRPYIPIGFLTPEIIPSNKIQIVAGATLFDFGVLTSAMHMAWVQTVSGRLESRFSYSPAVYNNYPWPTEATAAQKQVVERAAQGVLDARQQFAGHTLADLYDRLAMPKPLRNAHRALDRAVDRCYRNQPFDSDRQRVEYLFGLYEKLTSLFAPGKKSRKKKQ